MMLSKMMCKYALSSGKWKCLIQSIVSMTTSYVEYSRSHALISSILKTYSLIIFKCFVFHDCFLSEFQQCWVFSCIYQKICPEVKRWIFRLMVNIGWKHCCLFSFVFPVTIQTTWNRFCFHYCYDCHMVVTL